MQFFKNLVDLIDKLMTGAKQREKCFNFITPQLMNESMLTYVYINKSNL